jgi:hypothetical protein
VGQHSDEADRNRVPDCWRLENRMTFSVVFDPQTIRRSKLGSVTSVFYLILDERPFPEVGWNDFSEALFSELEVVVGRLADAPEGAESEFHFMDGPLSVVFRKADAAIEIVASHHDGAVGPVTTRCELTHLRKAVSKSAREFRKCLKSYDAKHQDGK